MGSECSLVFYRGTPLSPADLSQVFRRTVASKLTNATLAIGHSENVFFPPRRRGEEMWPLHAVYAFEQSGRYAVARGSTDGVAIPHDEDPGERSLSSLFRAAWQAVTKAQPEDQLIDQHPDLPLDWLIGVACEISRLRDRALWTMVSPQSTSGGIAMCEYGTIRDSRQFFGEQSELGPDLVLSRFAGLTSRVRDAFAHPRSGPREHTSYVLLTQQGEFLDPPRRIPHEELASFSHLL